MNEWIKFILNILMALIVFLLVTNYWMKFANWIGQRLKLGENMSHWLKNKGQHIINWLGIIFAILVLFIGYKGFSVVADQKVTLNHLETKNEQMKSTYDTRVAELEKENEQMQNHINVLEKDLLDALESKEDFETQNDTLSYEVEMLVLLESLIEKQGLMLLDYPAEELLAIYSVDGSNYRQYPHHFVLPSGDLDGDMVSIADALSTYLFSGLPLNYVETRMIDSQKIAVIDLTEKDGADVKWISHYFQGSTGGYITTLILVESFLQRERDLDGWIDGVMFTYEGEQGVIGDHVESLFSQTFFRNVDYFDYYEQYMNQ